jgi:tyrosinase
MTMPAAGKTVGVMDMARMTFAEMTVSRTQALETAARLRPVLFNRWQLNPTIIAWLIHLLLSKPRKNQAALTAIERDAFNQALQAALADGSYDPFPTIHSQPHMMHGFMGPMGALRFLPWHRAFLYQFEQMLQSHVPGVAIPYWDWANDPTLPAWLYLPPGVTRGPDISYAPPTQNDINNNVLAANDYVTMTQNLEGYHNTMHMYAGGNKMPNPAVSPQDPLFWLHHANVDRIWALWQGANPGLTPPLSGTDATMDPWTLSSTDVLDTIDLWYYYE